MKIKRSIRSKLILTVFIGCMIPFIIGGIYLESFIEHWSYDNNIETSNQILHQVNELINQSLITDMKEEVTMLASLDFVKKANHQLNNYTSFQPETFTYIEGSTEASIEAFFQSLKDSHASTNFIFLGTEDGGYMEYPRFLPKKSYDPRLRPWYIDSIAQNAILMSEPYVTNVTNEMVVSFTKQIRDENEVVGVVGISVGIKDLTNTINQIKVGDTGYVIVMSKNHKFIVSPKHPEWLLKTPDELGLNAFYAMQSYGETTFNAEIDGTEYVFHSLQPDENGLHMISVIAKSELLHKSTQITNILITIFAITFIVIFILILLITGRITKPILEIASVIDLMTDFQFSFDDNTNLDHYARQRDEIGVVSTALIEMHDNFKELMTQVENINNEIKHIDIEKNRPLKLSLRENNPFSNIISSMNVLLDNIYLYFDQLKASNVEMQDKNELLSSSEEELLAQLEEINQQKDFINYLAFHDALTGLPNRRKFVEFLTSRIAFGKKGAVVLLDIDNFKGINDTQGHVFGDRVLEAIANRLQGISNSELFISRFGGDEFLVLVEYEEDLNRIAHYIKLINHLFDEKIHVEDTDIEIHFSMGISLFPQDSEDVNQLVMNADLAMYCVKVTGKNGYRLFDRDMMDAQIKKSNIEAILRDAIENDGFKIVYQPQVDITTGQIFGYEALLRLKHHAISPSEFVDIAEKNGSIIKIGRIVTQKVIEQLALWKEEGLQIKPVSINYSANQLHDSGYLIFISTLLDSYRIEAKYLEIEITENIFLENKQATLAFLKQLHEMGIKIAIDDFGTGYSSLNYLAFLPVDFIKLDRSLSLKFLEMKNTAVMESLISLVHSLGLTVVAEGIEEVDQVRKLKSSNCDYIQGYFFSKPIDAELVPSIHSIIYTDF